MGGTSEETYESVIAWCLIIYMIFNVRFDSVAFLFVMDVCPHV